MEIKKVPFKYVHPNRKAVTNGSSSEPVQKSPAKNPRPQKNGLLAQPSTSEKVSVRLVVNFPKSGVSAEYDAMIRDEISRKHATLALLKRGVELFDTQNSERPPYAFEADYVETIRSIKRTTYDQFKQKHDPHEILSARALGKLLGAAVMANYFVHSKSEEQE